MLIVLYHQTINYMSILSLNILSKYINNIIIIIVHCSIKCHRSKKISKWKRTVNNLKNLRGLTHFEGYRVNHIFENEKSHRDDDIVLFSFLQEREWEGEIEGEGDGVLTWL